MKFKIKYSIANHRGTIRLIPLSDDAKFLCEMNGSKTITAAMLRTIGKYYPSSILYTAAYAEFVRIGEPYGKYCYGLLPTMAELSGMFAGHGPLTPDKLERIARIKPRVQS